MLKDSYTIEEKIIDVGDGHKLYAQLWGNADAGQTIVFLHGGPGSGCGEGHKELFDATRQRVLFFDQRGAGRSTAESLLEHNTTDELVEDITKVTDAFGIQNFALTGGSWGSCLALAYGLKHAEKVTSMVLRGIFTGRRSEIDFIDKGQIKSFYPEVWDRFANSVPAEFFDDPGAYHQARMFNGGDEARSAAVAYNDLEGSIMKLDDRAALPKGIDLEAFDTRGTTIETYYLVNGCFMPDGHIIKNAAQLTMPVALVQGRYDMVCPPITAYELNKVLPNSQLYWTIAGHSGNDRANVDTVKALLSDIA
jgi:proline iminopeptidase